MKQERLESLLTTIDRLKVTTVNQLARIHDLGGYRNACRVVSQLAPYTHQYRELEKIIYLNKEGRALIGSTKEVKRTPIIQHTLLANEAYIYLDCPRDWTLEVELEQGKGLNFNLGGTITATKKVVADAVFTRNGYVHLVEIDNIRDMKDNMKKIVNYKDIWKDIEKNYKLQPILYFFTTSANRKSKLEGALRSVRSKVLTFDEIR